MMTAKSELFVGESIRDLVEDVLGDAMATPIEVEVPKTWLNIWDEVDFPIDGQANIIEVTENNTNTEVVGTVKWKTKLVIARDGHEHPYDQAEAEMLQITYKGKEYVDIISAVRNELQELVKKRDETEKQIEEKLGCLPASADECHCRKRVKYTTVFHGNMDSVISYCLNCGGVTE